MRTKMDGRHSRSNCILLTTGSKDFVFLGNENWHSSGGAYLHRYVIPVSIAILRWILMDTWKLHCPITPRRRFKVPIRACVKLEISNSWMKVPQAVTVFRKSKNRIPVLKFFGNTHHLISLGTLDWTIVQCDWSIRWRAARLSGKLLGCVHRQESVTWVASGAVRTVQNCIVLRGCTGHMLTWNYLNASCARHCLAWRTIGLKSAADLRRREVCLCPSFKLSMAMACSSEIRGLLTENKMANHTALWRGAEILTYKTTRRTKSSPFTCSPSTAESNTASLQVESSWDTFRLQPEEQKPSFPSLSEYEITVTRNCCMAPTRDADSSHWRCSSISQYLGNSVCKSSIFQWFSPYGCFPIRWYTRTALAR